MYYSPLRYPGGKSKFAPKIKSLMSNNNLNEHYVEPFAGGAGVALDLLFNGYCTDIHINDIDSAIYNFWISITNETEKFIRLIQDTEVTISEWHNQKIKLNQPNLSPIEYGFATFFLNRTNRSGILKAGVIGGKNQSGNYKLDCRFNKIDLIKRIAKVGEYSEKIHVYNEDALEFLERVDSILPNQSLIYLDPPYYVNGQQLYRNFYNHNDHQMICDKLSKINTPWIVSYDNHDNIKSMYSKYNQVEYYLNYSLNKKVKAQEVMIFHNSVKA